MYSTYELISEEGDTLTISFFNDYSIFEVPSRFSYQHVVYLLIDVLYIIGLVLLCRKLSTKTVRIILISLASMCCLIFLGRMFFGWEWSRIYNDGSKTTLLPLELCNMNIFITLIALIINKKFLNNYLYFVSLVGGMILILVFPDCHMITAGRNIFHYMFLFFGLRKKMPKLIGSTAFAYMYFMGSIGAVLAMV